MDFLADFGLFLAKTLTLLGGVAFVLVAIATTGQRIRKFERQGHIEVNSLNDKYRDMTHAVQANVLPEAAYNALCKSEKKEEKARHKSEKKQAASHTGTTALTSRVFVLNFDGDIRASACEALTEEVTAVLTQATPSDEVVLCLESSGGMVHSYGLAASQLQRIRDAGIPLTVCVDKVAASGGYMMACIANRIIAAPFAVLGSIGVVAQIPNIHRLLKKHDIDYEMHTAGEYKRTLTVFGENTEKGRQKFQQDIEETHDLFKQFVAENRPSLVMDTVATGEAWFGQKALALGLVDELQTSSGYLFTRHKEASLFQIKWVEKHSVAERLGLAAEMAIERIVLRCWERLEQQGRFFR